MKRRLLELLAALCAIFGGPAEPAVPNNGLETFSEPRPSNPAAFHAADLARMTGPEAK